MGFEIRKGTSESDAKTFFAMCNTKVDASAQLATFFAPIELRFFKHVVRIPLLYLFFHHLPDRIAILTPLFETFD